MRMAKELAMARQGHPLLREKRTSPDDVARYFSRECMERPDAPPRVLHCTVAM